MWDWYTGTIIWKTQNPWTAMRGQMYDYYLDPNACLYGLHSGSEPLHGMYNLITGTVGVVNNTFETKRDLMLVVKTHDMKGVDSLITQVFIEIQPSSSKNFLPIKTTIDKLAKDEGTFLSIQLLDVNKTVVSNNTYWLPDAEGNYSGLKKMPASQLKVSSKRINAGKVEVTLINPAKAPVAFFNRLSLINSATKKRVLPVFYSDNYVSVLPGEQRKIILDYEPKDAGQQNMLSVSGWNLPEQLLPITN